VDGRFQAIQLRIKNRGRASGLLEDVAVVSETLVIEGVSFEGFEDDAFEPLVLPAYSEMRLIIKAPDGCTFDRSDEVVVSVGGEEKRLVPTPENVGYYGLKSILPPAS